MSRIPAITGRNGPKYSLSLLGPQLLAGRGLDTPAAAPVDLALSSLFWGGRGRSYSWTGGDFRAGLGHFWGRVCVSMAAGKRFRGVRNFSAGGCRQLFPGCAWLPAKSTAAAGITWAAARPMAAADCRDVRPMGAEDPRWTCDSCCGMRPCDSCCLGQRSIAPGRRGTAPGRATG